MVPLVFIKGPKKGRLMEWSTIKGKPFGLDSISPIFLKESNNILIWLLVLPFKSLSKLIESSAFVEAGQCGSNSQEGSSFYDE